MGIPIKALKDSIKNLIKQYEELLKELSFYDKGRV